MTFFAHFTLLQGVRKYLFFIQNGAKLCTAPFMDPQYQPILNKFKKIFLTPYLDPLKMWLFWSFYAFSKGYVNTFLKSKMAQTLLSPLGVQFRKKCMKLKMFLMLQAISIAHRKIDQFNISDHLKTPHSRQDLICSNPTDNSHSPLGVQFRKKCMKLKMFIKILAISVAQQKIACRSLFLLSAFCWGSLFR